MPHGLRELLQEEAIGVPALGSEIRPGVLTPEAIDAQLAALPGAPGAHLRALVLLWHDHLDASHQVSQGLEDATAAYIHGMMHRREGDYGNAKYWFHRAGPQKGLHSLETQLATREAERFLLDRGRWNAEAFVDCCANATVTSTPRYLALQREEFHALGAWFLSHPQ
jgi:hypothetical protein